MSRNESTTTLPKLTPAKAASVEIGIPYTSLRDLTFQGLLPVVKVGSHWYYDRADLAQFIERRKEILG